MNRRVLVLTTLICIGIVIACVIAGSTYYARVTVPIALTQDLLLAQNAATSTSLSQSAANFATQTQLAIPTFTTIPSPTITPTLPPLSIICDAEVQGTPRAMYPVPGLGHTLFNKIIAMGTKAKILGRLEDNGWYKVEINGETGWMKSDSLRISNSCRPTVFDLHYLADWLNSDEALILDDTFSSNANIWVDTGSQANLLVNTTPQGESVLNIQASDEKIITTTNPHASDIYAFKLYTSITADKVNIQSHFGFRFRDSGSEYFQISFLPASCKIEVYATKNLVYTNNVNPKICIDRYYDIYLTLSADYKLVIQINGFDPISINLQDPDGRYSHGKIDLLVNEADISLDYIVVTTPK